LIEETPVRFLLNILKHAFF